MFPFPNKDPGLLIPWQVIALHGFLVVAALLPILALFLQTRRPAERGDLWLWVACMVCFPLPFAVARALLPEYSRPFLLGLLLFSEFVSTMALVATLRRLAKHRKAVSAVSVLASLLLLAMLVAMLLPAVPSAREAARRMACSNNIKQIMLGMINYHDQNGTLPAATSRAENGVPTSWRVNLLPYIEDSHLWRQYDAQQPWDSPANEHLAKISVNGYRCPSSPDAADSEGRAYTAYAVAVGPGAAFSASGVRSLADIPGGTAGTIGVVEACGRNIVWTKPEDVDLVSLQAGINLPGATRGMSDGVLSSHHPEGALTGLLDGSVHFLPQRIDSQVLEQLLSRHESLEEKDW